MVTDAAASLCMYLQLHVVAAPTTSLAGAHAQWNQAKAACACHMHLLFKCNSGCFVHTILLGPTAATCFETGSKHRNANSTCVENQRKAESMLVPNEMASYPGFQSCVMPPCTQGSFKHEVAQLTALSWRLLQTAGKAAGYLRQKRLLRKPLTSFK